MAENNPVKEPVVEWTRVIGGALAAVSSAVLLSTLGAVGTIAGAALGSVIVSVSSSVYARGLSRSRRRMAQAQEAALRRVGVAQAEVLRARRRDGAGTTEAHLDRADEHLARARDRLEAADPEPEPEPLRRRIAGILDQLPWRRVALVAAAGFVIAIAVVTGFELIAGRPVSSYTGGTSSHHGTSFSNIDNGGHHPATPSPSPTGSTSPSPTPGGSASGGPSSSPSPSPTGTPSATPTPTTTPSETPTVEPSPSAIEPTPGG
jgi:hypothetical protein